MKQLSPAIFLDRDGTLCRDAVYLSRIEDFEPLPAVDGALRLLQDAGYRLFVATNQSGVARGYFTLETVNALNAEIRDYFLERGVNIEDFAVCPHHPEGTVAEFAVECDCRKPKPGLLLALAQKHGLDLARSYMVGDMPRDAQAGLSAGTHAVLIPTEATLAERATQSQSLDKDARLKEFTSLLDFARSVRGVDASHDR
jgi:D-glycero-D-manno-heptose 1,7-bisphosphate phosphatase